MAVIRHNFMHVVKEYVLITLGILIYTIAWSVFLIPHNLVGGGVTGISSIIQYATGGAIKIGYSYFAINAILLIISLFTLGPSFGVKTVYAVVLASVSLNLCPELIPASFIQSISIDNGKLMSVIMGGMMAGLGIGMAMSQGGSTGGTDIIALIVNKYRGVSPGRMILWIDVFIIATSLVVPSYRADGTVLPLMDKILVVVYGFLLVTVCSTVVDYYLAGSKQSVQLFINSKKYAEIADAITHELHRGVTELNGQGWYTKEDAHVLMVLTRKSDLNLLLRYIKAIDSNAFVSVSYVTGVYGKGFEEIKGGKNGSKSKGKSSGNE